MSDAGSRCRFYRKDELALRPDVEGARYWAVALDHAMLTYFEVDAHSRFPRHEYEAEQITFVLEGTLYFETDDGVTAVNAGDVFAVPGHLQHAVFTKDAAVRAVDAWSPVRPDLAGARS